jgi:hypothetical protein
MGGLMGEFKAALPRLAGTLVTSAAVRFVAQKFPGTAYGSASPTGGEPWSPISYAVGLGVAMFAPKLLGKFVNATEFRRGAVDLLLRKAVYTGIIARSETAQQWLGASEGDQIYDPSGQGYIYDDGSYQAMQGLVDTRELPMGTLVDTQVLPMGTYIPRTKQDEINAAYAGRATSNPYA